MSFRHFFQFKIYSHFIYTSNIKLKTYKVKRLLFFCVLFSSGYDHVLLLQYLVPRIFEVDKTPRVDKNGTKVTSISIAGGLQFRDIAKLLAPSTNLRNFGRLFGLEQAKAHFPFAALTSVDDLQRVGLPEEDEIWRNELSGEICTPERLASIKREASQLFVQAQCHTMGDYLREYLYLDVDILYKAAQGWRQKLYQLIKLDFIECNRCTISGLSYSAGLKSLEAKQRLGNFFPNNSQMYRLLRLGMRG